MIRFKQRAYTSIVENIERGVSESMPQPARPFVDFLNLSARSGAGGKPVKGAKRSPTLKGPGYGGHGGSVYITASSAVDSLAEIPQETRAHHGGDAHDGSRGLHADDLALKVPLGTILRERVKTPLKDSFGGSLRKSQFKYQFLKDGETLRLVAGGLGGIAPKSITKNDGRPPEIGEKKHFELELRSLADCVLVGGPNSGKSALLAALTRTFTRIGPEEGSTTRPHAGHLRFRDGWEASVLDIPGIKNGAASDELAGKRVLRHTWRAKLLIYVVDIASDCDAFSTIEQLRGELRLYDPKYFNDRKWLVVGTKCDFLHRDALFKLDALQIQLRARLDPEVRVIGVSSRLGLGIRETVLAIRRVLEPGELELPSFRARNSVDEVSRLLPHEDTIAQLRTMYLPRMTALLVNS